MTLLRAILLICALLMCGGKTSGLTINASGLVQYVAFDGTSYTLKPWPGKIVAVLTPTNTSYRTEVMSNIVWALDRAYVYYRSSTGLQPTSFDATTLGGLDTIAVVNSTCGAGCSYVGFTGTEILPQYFQTLYDGVASANEFDQVLFYEFGRNYWFYSNQLAYHPPDIDPVATGFAVYMRFASMAAIGVAGGPYNGTSFDGFATAVTNLIDSYVLLPGLNWSNTFRLSQAPPNPLGLGGTDLIASLLMRIGRDFGGTHFTSDFWQQARSRPSAQSTLQAADNFVLTACAAVHANLTRIFSTHWKWPVSSAAVQEAQSRWGAPISFTPRVVVQNAAAGGLNLSWESEPGVSYQLQQSGDLQTWSNIGGAISGNGSMRSTTAPTSGPAQQFFRLLVL